MTTEDLSQRQYLVRAIYEWCQDFNFTPHLACYVDEQCQVPLIYVENNQIIFNIGTSAIKNIVINAQGVSFNASFEGSNHNIIVPINNVLAIFARENGQGMQFTYIKAKSEVVKKRGLKLIK